MNWHLIGAWAWLIICILYIPYNIKMGIEEIRARSDWWASFHFSCVLLWILNIRNAWLEVARLMP